MPSNAQKAERWLMRQIPIMGNRPTMNQLQVGFLEYLEDRGITLHAVTPRQGAFPAIRAGLRRMEARGLVEKFGKRPGHYRLTPLAELQLEDWEMRKASQSRAARELASDA
jgi:hypothetical protein